MKSRWKKNIVTNQMKSEYFQEHLEKSIEITRAMILFDDPNEIIKRKSKSEGKWLPFEGRKRIRITRKMTLFDNENTKLTIIFIYEGNGIKNRASIFSTSRRKWLFFKNVDKIFLEKDSNAQVEWEFFSKKQLKKHFFKVKRQGLRLYHRG